MKPMFDFLTFAFAPTLLAGMLVLAGLGVRACMREADEYQIRRHCLDVTKDPRCMERKP